MNKGVIIRAHSCTLKHTIKFLDADSKYKFLHRMYLDNDDIPVEAESDDLVELLDNIVGVNVNKTYVKLYISPMTYNRLFKRDATKQIQIIIGLYDIPFMYRKEDFAELRNITLNLKEYDTVTTNFETQLKEAESRVFRNDEEDDPF